MKAAYSIMRTGRILQIVHRKFGHNATRIMQRLLAFGHASVGNLETELRSQLSQQPSMPSNGVDHGDTIETVAIYANPANHTSVRQLLQRLSEEEYIIQVRDSHFQTWSDARQEAELHIRTSEGSLATKGKAAQKMIDDKIEAEMRRRARASLRQPTVSYNNTSLKRPGPTDNDTHSAKRPRVGDHTLPKTISSGDLHTNGAGILTVCAFRSDCNSADMR